MEKRFVIDSANGLIVDFTDNIIFTDSKSIGKNEVADLIEYIYTMSHSRSFKFHGIDVQNILSVYNLYKVFPDAAKDAKVLIIRFPLDLKCITTIRQFLYWLMKSIQNNFEAMLNAALIDGTKYLFNIHLDDKVSLPGNYRVHLGYITPDNKLIKGHFLATTETLDWLAKYYATEDTNRFLESLVDKSCTSFLIELGAGEISMTDAEIRRKINDCMLESAGYEALVNNVKKVFKIADKFTVTDPVLIMNCKSGQKHKRIGYRFDVILDEDKDWEIDEVYKFINDYKYQIIAKINCKWYEYIDDVIFKRRSLGDLLRKEVIYDRSTKQYTIAYYFKFE